MNILRNILLTMLILLNTVQADIGHYFNEELFGARLEIDKYLQYTMFDHSGTSFDPFVRDNRSLVKQEALKFFKFINDELDNGRTPVFGTKEKTVYRAMIRAVIRELNDDVEIVGEVMRNLKKAEMTDLYSYVPNANAMGMFDSLAEHGLLNSIIREGMIKEIEVQGILFELQSREDSETSKEPIKNVLELLYDGNDKAENLANNQRILSFAGEMNLIIDKERNLKRSDFMKKSNKRDIINDQSIQKLEDSHSIRTMLVVGMSLIIVLLAVLIGKKKTTSV